MNEYPHYVPKALPQYVRDKADHNQLEGPMFIGQGATKIVGSDRYGYYVVCIAITADGKKQLVGLVSANAEFVKDWTYGDQGCSLPNGSSNPIEHKATLWIIPGRKSRRTGKQTWHRCDENGDNIGDTVDLNWNGAYGYLDPSF